MPVKTGGGWVDSVSVFDVSYASAGGSDEGLMGNETNDLPMVQADIGKDVYKVFQWGHILRVPLIDQQKLQKIGRNLDDVLNKGLHLVHDKFLDKTVYMTRTSARLPSALCGMLLDARRICRGWCRIL